MLDKEQQNRIKYLETIILTKKKEVEVILNSIEKLVAEVIQIQTSDSDLNKNNE